MEAINYFLPEHLLVVGDELLEEGIGMSDSDCGGGTLEADGMLEALNVVRVGSGCLGSIVVGASLAALASPSM